MALTDKIPEPLKRQIGPFPLWVWVGGVGGGIVLFMYLNRGGNSSSATDDSDEDNEAAEFDFEDAVSGPGFDDTADGSAGSVNYESRIAALEGRKDKTGLTRKQVKRIARNTPRKKSRPKAPNCRKGYHAAWRKGRWVCAKNRSFTLEEPHLQMVGAPNGSAPTISLQNVPAIGIASPDTTPRAKVTPLNTTRPADPMPFIAERVPPAPPNRAWGRPFHGANR
jgi:hypothetical protein